MTTIIVPTLPVAQPRQRHTVTGRNYTPTQHPVNLYKMAVRQAWQASDGDLLEGPVYVGIDFVFNRPKARGKKHMDVRIWHVIKPDLDNLMKSTLDCLSGLAYLDDKQVASVRLTKTETANGEQPHAQITILPIATPFSG